MKLHYWQSAEGNFGDDLNLWLWDALMPGWRDWDDTATLLGTGTLINERTLSMVQKPVIMGSGVGYGSTPSLKTLRRADIRCVRGPRSAELLGMDSELGIVDPAVMLPDLGLPFLDPSLSSGQKLFIPHLKTAQLALNWETIAARAGLVLQRPTGDEKAVIRAIAGAELVVTEAMHGAIIADAFRVPWIAVRLSDSFNLFKWGDWADSLGVPLAIADIMRPLRIPYRAALKLGWPTGCDKPDSLSRATRKLPRTLEVFIAANLARAARRIPQLSDKNRLEDCKSRFREAVNRACADYGM